MRAGDAPRLSATTRGGGSTRSAAYIAEMSSELHSLALAEGFEILAYLLGMVHHEAAALRKEGRDEADRDASSRPS